MAKRRTFKPGPRLLPVLQVKWVDARTTGMSDDGRQPLDIDLPELWTVGMVTHEDDRQYILASEIEAHADYMNQGMRYIQVPKAWIIEKRAVGEVVVHDGGPEVPGD